MSNSARIDQYSETRTQNPYLRLLIYLCAAAFIVWSAPILLSLHERWLRAGFEHGYPIAIMTALLVWWRIRRDAIPIGVPSVSGLVVLSTAVLVVAIGNAATIAIIPELLLPLAVLAFVWTVMGRAAAGMIFAPVLFIYFAIPFWQLFEILLVDAPSLNEGLRVLTTLVASWAVHATGIPAYIDGDLVHISSGTFEIAEGCSGRAYFIVAIELSVFFGLAYLGSWRNRLLMIAATAGLSLVANWLRVWMLILIGHATEMESTLVDDHEMFGWGVFLLVLIPIMMLGRYLENAGDSESRERDGFAPRGERGGSRTLVAASVLLIAAVSVNFRIYFTNAQAFDSSNIELPTVLGWQAVGEWSGVSRPDFRAPAAETAGWYRRSGTEVGVYIANYPVQQRGSEAIFFANRPTGESQDILGQDSIQVTSVSGTTYTFREFHVEDGSSRRLVWSGSVVAGTSTRSTLHAKFLQLLAAVRGRVDAQVLVVTSRCSQVGCASARAQLSDFIQLTVEELYDAAAASMARDP